MWYAQNPGRAARQLAGDLAVLLWVTGWALAAAVVHRTSSRITELFGGDVAKAVRGLPGPMELLGLLDPSLWPLVVSVAGAAVFLLLTVPVVGWWLPRRLRWHRRATAAHELAASADGRELLALRSLMRPLDDVARTASLAGATPGALAEGWRDADPETLDALADAELARLGLRGT